jgi:Zn-dependent peptidase ImmA (M78 family)
VDVHRVAEERSLDIRGRLQLGIQPIDDIVAVLDNLGLTVFVQPWGGDGPLGAFLPRGDRSYVFLNGDQTLPRLRFSGAHELGHFVFSDGPRLDGDEQFGSEDRAIEERRANSFAASFLLPRDGIRLAFEDLTKVTGEGVVRLATQFGVSYEMATYRLHNTGLINAAKRDRLIDERAAVLTPEFRRRIGPMWYLPREYVENAFDAYLASRIDFGRLAELLRADAHHRHDLARQLHERKQLHDDDALEFGLTPHP